MKYNLQKCWSESGAFRQEPKASTKKEKMTVKASNTSQSELH